MILLTPHSQYASQGHRNSIRSGLLILPQLSTPSSLNSLSTPLPLHAFIEITYTIYVTSAAAPTSTGQSLKTTTHLHITMPAHVEISATGECVVWWCCKCRSKHRTTLPLTSPYPPIGRSCKTPACSHQSCPRCSWNTEPPDVKNAPRPERIAKKPGMDKHR